MLPAKLHQPTRRKVRVLIYVNVAEVRRVSLDEGAKRKLSDSASTREDAKRARMEEQGRKNAEILAKREREREEAKRKQQELFKSQGIDLEDYKIDGPGPYTFFCWADAIMSVVDSADDHALFYHKQSALDAFRPVFALPKNKRRKAMHGYLDVVSTWWVHVDDEAREIPEAGKLRELWEKVSFGEDVPEEGSERGSVAADVTSIKKTEEGDSGDGDGEKDGESGWWYEVYAQREKPEEGKAALEVTLDGDGTFWLTGFKEADLAGRRAMSFMCDFFTE